jgi:hypothetical protein
LPNCFVSYDLLLLAADWAGDDFGIDGLGFFDDGDFFAKAASHKAAAEAHKEKIKAYAEAAKAKAHKKEKAAAAAEAAKKHKEKLKEHKKKFNKHFNADLHENETNALEKVKAFKNHNKKANVEFAENFAARRGC